MTDLYSSGTYRETLRYSPSPQVFGAGLFREILRSSSLGAVTLVSAGLFREVLRSSTVIGGGDGATQFFFAA